MSTQPSAAAPQLNAVPVSLTHLSEPSAVRAVSRNCQSRRNERVSAEAVTPLPGSGAVRSGSCGSCAACRAAVFSSTTRRTPSALARCDAVNSCPTKPFAPIQPPAGGETGFQLVPSQSSTAATVSHRSSGSIVPLPAGAS
ncbi:hypothetical protein [Leucobacter soli]|uniref:hypothetical protein n=1 Tax=Leucobacter soli TaxID=2812850 RepID=UPI00361F2FC0